MRYSAGCLDSSAASTRSDAPVTPRGRVAVRKPRRSPTSSLSLVRLTLALSLIAGACGGGGASVDTSAPDPTSVNTTGDGQISSTTVGNDGGGQASTTSVGVDPGGVPDACDVIDIDEWEAITGTDLTIPEQDTAAPQGGTTCGITAEGTTIPVLVTVSVNIVGQPGGVANLIAFIDGYEGMQEVSGIGDRALYWDEETIYEGDPITDWPSLAFEKGTVNVAIVLIDDEVIDRSHLESLAKSVADQV